MCAARAKGRPGLTEIAPLVSVLLGPWPNSSWFSLGKPWPLRGPEELYITGSAFLTDKPTITLLLTKTSNYCGFPALVDNIHICSCIFHLSGCFSLTLGQRGCMIIAPMTIFKSIFSICNFLSFLRLIFHWLRTNECSMWAIRLDPREFLPPHSVRGDGGLVFHRFCSHRAHFHQSFRTRPACMYKRCGLRLNDCAN